MPPRTPVSAGPGLQRLLLGVALLAGASPAQEEEPPQDPPKLPVPVDQDAEARGAVVRELTLDEALRRGRRHNVSLRAAELLPEQARLDLVFAEAGFHPELFGSGGYAESESPPSFFAPAQQNVPALKSQTIDARVGWRQRVITGGLFELAFAPTRFDSNRPGSDQFTSVWSTSFRQPLMRGAWTDYNLASVNSARYRHSQATQDFERAVQDTLLQIVQAYWELSFARENWRVVSSALAVAQEQLRITDERIRVEELAPRDRIADEAEVARRREEQITAENAIRDREDDLRRLLYDGSDARIWKVNLRPVSEIDVVPAPAELDFEALVEVAVQNRPDLRALRSSVAAAEVAQLEAERDMLPQLDLIGSYSSDGVRSDAFRGAFQDASEQEYPDWSVRLEFALPIGNHAARSRERRAALEVERQRRLLHAATLDVIREVREAVRNLATLAQSIRAGTESVRLARSNLDTEQVKLRVGASTAFEVQRRNQELREARSRLLRNQLDYRTAESRLLYVQGLLQAGAE